MNRIAVLVVSTLVTLGVGAGTAASAGASIQPGQMFVGFVNNQRPNATIQMACFGPIRPGQTGHPFAGQTLSVQRSLDIPGGNTGSTGRQIQAVFSTPTVTVVTFVATAPSRTSRPDTVHVSFIGQP